MQLMGNHSHALHLNGIHPTSIQHETKEKASFCEYRLNPDAQVVDRQLADPEYAIKETRPNFLPWKWIKLMIRLGSAKPIPERSLLNLTPRARHHRDLA